VQPEKPEELSSVAVVLEEEAGSNRRRLRHQRSEAGSSIGSIQRREVRVFFLKSRKRSRVRSLDVFEGSGCDCFVSRTVVILARKKIGWMW
jgi:hypothetical protein